MKKIATITALMLILCGCEPVQKRTETVRIIAVEKQTVTSGNKDNFSTHIYWLINTDKGTFQVETSGLWACPEAASLKVDSTYTVTINGFFKSSFLGVYPFITEII